MDKIKAQFGGVDVVIDPTSQKALEEETGRWSSFALVLDLSEGLPVRRGERDGPDREGVRDERDRHRRAQGSAFQRKRFVVRVAPRPRENKLALSWCCF